MIDTLDLLATFVMYAIGFVGGCMFVSGITDRRALIVLRGLLCIPAGVAAGACIECVGSIIAKGCGL